MTTTTANPTSTRALQPIARPRRRSLLKRMIKLALGPIDPSTADVAAMGTLPGELSMGACHLMALATGAYEQADRETYSGGAIAPEANESMPTPERVSFPLARSVRSTLGSVARCLRWRSERAAASAGEARVSLRKLTGLRYRADEFCWPDDFFDPYVGKDYGGLYSEVVSMGLQHMWLDPVRFAQRDPDFFDFIYRAMRGDFT